MTQDVLSVHTAQKVSDVTKLLAQGINHVPVVSGTILIGLITSSDIISLGISTIGPDAGTLDAYYNSCYKIEDIMVKDLITISENDSVKDAAKALANGGFHSVPVVNDKNELKGIVTSTDLIKYLLEQY